MISHLSSSTLETRNLEKTQHQRCVVSLNCSHHVGAIQFGSLQMLLSFCKSSCPLFDAGLASFDRRECSSHVQLRFYSRHPLHYLQGIFTSIWYVLSATLSDFKVVVTWILPVAHQSLQTSVDTLLFRINR